MNRNFYEEKFEEIKNQILEEIRTLISMGSAHNFKEKFYVHYIDGEVATTEICSAVVVRPGGMVEFHVHREPTAYEDVVGGVEVYKYDSVSFIDILCRLKAELCEEKLSCLRNLIKNAGGKVDFDGSFGFNSLVADNHVAGEKSMITSIKLDKTNGNQVFLECLISGENVVESENNIPLDQLDSIIACVKKQTMKKFAIRVSGSFSRCWDIEANSYDEALAIAKVDWRINPLCYADSNGEDWDGNEI